MRSYSKQIYTKEVLLKSAYSFTDECFIHLDCDEKNYFVELKLKNNTENEDIYYRFENELVAQETRRIVSEKTKVLREMIVARSLSSTIINKDPELEAYEGDYNADNILVDWFEKNE